jgi:pimeloyl-[acyl-carrier protein] methyl ester esterase
MLALRAALLAPERVSGLILVGATASFTQRTDWPAAQPPEVVDEFFGERQALSHGTDAAAFRRLAEPGRQPGTRGSAARLLAGLRQGPTPDAAALSSRP